MKKILSLMLAMLMLISFSACESDGNGDDSDSDAVVDATADEIASAIISKVSFTDTLSAVDSEVAEKLFSVDEGVKITAYCGSGALAEEIVIIESTKPAVKEMFEAYREKQIGIFEKYNTDEVAKLEKAYIEVFGNYTVYCVSPSTDNVKSALSSLTK